MARKQTQSVADMQPDELGALKALTLEFVRKVEHVDNEIETLKQDRKEVIEEYKEKLDVRTLNAALRVIKIKRGIEHKDTFDAFIEVLEDPAQ